MSRCVEKRGNVTKSVERNVLQKRENRCIIGAEVSENRKFSDLAAPDAENTPDPMIGAGKCVKGESYGYKRSVLRAIRLKGLP